MSNQRVDLYKDVHKGLRYELFAFSIKAGSIDWDNTDSTKALGEELDTLLHLLRSHVVHENTFCHPLITRLVLGGARALDIEHREQEAMLDDLEAHFKHMISKGSGRRSLVKDGIQFYRALNRSLARYLVHLDQEEAQVMPTLWDLCSDEELTGVLGEIIASMKPEEFLSYLEVMFPAMNTEERANILSGLRSSAPEEFYNTVCKLAERLLSQTEWTTLKAHL